jgi:hypothetical protein
MIVEAKCRVQRPALECLRWVKGRRGRQADGTAGLPPAPEIAGAFQHLRFVPKATFLLPTQPYLSQCLATSELH